jgi:hypothetical protein
VTATRRAADWIRAGLIVSAIVLGVGHSAAGQVNGLSIRLDSVVAPKAQFGAVAQIVAIDSSRAVMLDGGDGTVSLVRTARDTPQQLSRHGEGPGEFRFALRIGRYRDSIWAVAQNRFAVLPFDGRPGVTIDPSVATVPIGPTQHILLLGLLGNRAALAVQQYLGELQDDSAHRQGQVLLGPPGMPQWTVVASVHASGPLNVVLSGSPGRSGPITESYQNPFRVADLVLPEPDGAGFVIVRQHGVPATAQGSVTLERYDSVGRRLGARIVPVARNPDGDRIVAALRDALQQRVQRSRLHPSAGDVARILDQQLGPHPLVPVASGGFVAGDSSIWLHRPGVDDGPARWLRIVDRTRVAEAMVLPGCTPLDEQQGRLWLTCTENDVPVIRRAWISRSAR